MDPEKGGNAMEKVEFLNIYLCCICQIHATIWREFALIYFPWKIAVCVANRSETLFIFKPICNERL